MAMQPSPTTVQQKSHPATRTTLRCDGCRLWPAKPATEICRGPQRPTEAARPQGGGLPRGARNSRSYEMLPRKLVEGCPCSLRAARVPPERPEVDLRGLPGATPRKGHARGVSADRDATEKHSFLSLKPHCPKT